MVQLQLTKSEENESLMGRTSDPRLDKVLALIDRGIAPETALQRHGNPVSLEHLKYRVLKQRDAPPDDEPRHGSRRPSKASTSTPSARSAGKQPARPPTSSGRKPTPTRCEMEVFEVKVGWQGGGLSYGCQWAPTRTVMARALETHRPASTRTCGAQALTWIVHETLESCFDPHMELVWQNARH